MICIFCTAQTCSCSGTVAILQDGGQHKPLSRAAVNIRISSSWQTEIELRRRQTVSAGSAPQRFWRVSAKKLAFPACFSFKLKANSHRHARHDTDSNSTVLSCLAGGVDWALIQRRTRPALSVPKKYHCTSAAKQRGKITNSRPNQHVW